MASKSQVGWLEAKTRLPQLLARVARGEHITITKRAKPVAMLVPVAKVDRDIKQVIAEFKAYSKRQGRTLGGISSRQLIEEGRRF
jgi:prevent-host-death family protein